MFMLELFICWVPVKLYGRLELYMLPCDVLVLVVYPMEGWVVELVL